MKKKIILRKGKADEMTIDQLVHDGTKDVELLITIGVKSKKRRYAVARRTTAGVIYRSHALPPTFDVPGAGLRGTVGDDPEDPVRAIVLKLIPDYYELPIWNYNEHADAVNRRGSTKSPIFWDLAILR